ncbi:hypothetical protein MIND_01224200 [Mycena indigotica]|uniref:F-box domain-containing protein n=1 Tax=Mycena indigotica TaxID=2126181 RepID=A0A8H6S638_9AGAR|nr:uncharacterized protein MIND_01224200 [Mycena indigotica]KAF7291985.1 hypothetical protein MIND_01224200 [Mycena indigotica]
MPRRSLPDLPPELWLQIYRIATEELSPLARARALDDEFDPLDERHLQRYFKAVRSLGRVCRFWHKLAQELLFENIWINPKRWSSLTAALDQTNNITRTALLSPTRFDHNIALLRREGFSDTLEVLSQPEYPRTMEYYPSERGIQLPPLNSLKRIFWVESSWSADLLQSVLAAAAPNIEHITLSTSATLGSDSNILRVPNLPRLRSLSVSSLTPFHTLAVLHAGLPNLRHLTIDPPQLEPDFPPINSLTTLTITGSTFVRFATIHARFPGLRELQFDARATLFPPQEKQSFLRLALVRLFLPIQPSIFREPIITLNLSFLRKNPAFGAVESVVLDGKGWDYLRVPSAMHPQQELEMLQEKGCRIKYIPDSF